MPISDPVTYAQMVLAQVRLDRRVEYWRTYENLFAYADAEDPESFDRYGQPSTDPTHGELGFFPVLGVLSDDEPLYVPCFERFRLIAEGNVDPPPFDGGSNMQVSGQRMIDVLPTWTPSTWTALVIPIMSAPKSDYTLQQQATAFIPFAGDRRLSIQAVKTAGGLKIILGWD